MEYFKLFGTDLEVSRLSLGTWSFSGAKVWGESNDADAIKTVHKALDLGINFIDSAEKYGDGKSEEVLGDALVGRRDKAIVATKVYSDHLEYNQVIECCEASLKRLKTDYIDLYQIHWPSPETPVEETFSAFEKLKKDGKIRAVGVCNYGKECIAEIAGRGVVTNQLPYSLLWRQVESKIGSANEENNIALWAYSPLSQGLLTGKYKTIDDVPMGRRETRLYNGAWKAGRHTDPGFEEYIFPLLDELRVIARETNLSMPALAFAFLKAQKNVGSILVGSRDTVQLEENFNGFMADVHADVVKKIIELSNPLKAVAGDNPDMWDSAGGGRMR